MTAQTGADMPTATVRQCAILAGGLGTRLGALTATTPKPILPCGDRPFVAWLMRELIRFGVTEFLLLTGHLSAEVDRAADAIRSSLPREVRVVVSQEPVRAGTGGALFHARDRLAEKFLLCNGDTLFDCNVADLLAASARGDASALGWMVLRRLQNASRFGVVSMDRGRITGFQERPVALSAEEGSPGLINGGLYLFERAVLDHLAPVCSLETEVMPRLASAGALRGIEAEGYFRDIGVPDDFTRAQTEIPALLHRRAVFLDRDGVINVDHGYVGSRDRFEFIPGALETIRYVTRRGWHVFIVTNQSGVARGHYAEEAVQDLLEWIADQARLAGGTIDDARYCPFHENADVAAYRRPSDWRKPAPGMLLDLIRRWELAPSRCVMIGDQPSDMAAAEAAGVPGHLFPGGNLLDFVRPILDRTAVGA